MQHKVRHVRVAFLVNKENESCAILRAIFKDSYNRWGGRRSLIVPIVSKTANPEYLDWLVDYDPDIVYSYADINEETIEKINRRCSPAFLIVHNSRRNSPNTLEPNLGVTPISAFSLLPSISTGKTFPTLVSCYPGWDESEFITDNFGMAPHRDRTLYNSITMAPNVLKPENRKRNIVRKVIYGEPFYDEYGFLERLIKDEGIRSMSFYSSLESDIKLPHGNHQWRDGLNLFIGDNFEDRLYFWNSRHFISDVHRVHTPSLWLPEKCLDDDYFLELFIQYISSSHSPSGEIYVRSTSVDEGKISQFIERIKSNKPWRTIGYIRGGSEPPPQDRWTGARNASFSGYEISSRIDEKPFRLVPDEPQHFKAIPYGFEFLKKGSCMVDIALDRYDDHSPYVNKEHLWRLPRRKGVTLLFSPGYTGRVNSDYFPSFFYNFYRDDYFNQNFSTKEVIEVTFPDDESFFRHILTENSPYYDNELRNTKNNFRYQNIHISDKGKALKKLLSIFGNLHLFHKIIESYFWRDLIEDLCSIKKVKNNPKVVARFKQGLERDFGTEIKISDESCSRILRVLYHLPKERPIITFKVVEEKWDIIYKDALSKLNEKERSEVEIQSDEIKDQFIGNLKKLVSMGVFFQGKEWKCKECDHNNWISIERISLNFECEVCKDIQQIDPQNLVWDFHLNPKISGALYKQNSLGELWVLGQLLDGPDPVDSFYYIPQVNLYKSSDEKQPSNEIDIICVRNGKLIVGEVKDDSNQFNEEAIKKIISIAKEIKPDLVLLGYLSGKEPLEARGKLEKLGIEVIIAGPLPSKSDYFPWFDLFNSVKSIFRLL